MKKSLLFLFGFLVLVSCNSDKSQIENYLQNNYPDREIEIVGDVSSDSAFCPKTHLEEVGLELDNYKLQLDRLLAINPDSALKLARVLQNRFTSKDAFINLAYPKGKNNSKALIVKCNEDGKNRMITFYKDKTDEFIDFSSLDADEMVDSLLVSFEMLIDGINIIVNDKELNGVQTASAPKNEEASAEVSEEN